MSKFWRCSYHVGCAFWVYISRPSRCYLDVPNNFPWQIMTVLLVSSFQSVQNLDTIFQSCNTVVTWEYLPSNVSCVATNSNSQVSLLKAKTSTQEVGGGSRNHCIITNGLHHPNFRCLNIRYLNHLDTLSSPASRKARHFQSMIHVIFQWKEISWFSWEKW